METAVAIRYGVAAANAVLRVAFDPCCAACGDRLAAPLDGCVCAACWLGVDPPPFVEWPAGPLRDAAAGGDYMGTLRQIVHAFKYEQRRSLASPLAGLMRTHGGHVLAGADCVTPVPLHPWRRSRRGFNQAGDLASQLGLPVRSVLWRVRATAVQADLTAVERRRNVGHAFRLSPLLSREARAALRGQIVVLVDDVRTTGATLHACAEVLERAGVAEVRALTAAVRGLENVRGQAAQ